MDDEELPEGFEPDHSWEEVDPNAVLVVDNSPEEQRLRAEGGRAASPSIIQMPVQEFEVDREAGQARFRGTRGRALRKQYITPGEHVSDAEAYRQGDTQRRVNEATRMDQRLGPLSVNPAAMMFGAADALTLNHTDEIGGALSAAVGGDYEQSRDRIRSFTEGLRDERPVSYGAGVLGGAVAGLPSLAGRAATGMGRLATAVGEGIGYGAAGAAGASDAELGSGEHLRDIGTGAATGGVLGAGTGAVGEVGRGLLRQSPQALRDGAAVRRVRGLFGKDRPRVRDLQQVVGPGSQSQQAQQARRVLDVAGRRGVRSLDDAEGAVEAVGSELGETARTIDAQTRQQALQAGYRGNPPQRAVDTEGIAQRLEQFGQRLEPQGASDTTLGAISGEASRWRRVGPTFTDAWEARQRMTGPGSWNVGPNGMRPVGSADERQMYGLVREGLEESAERAGPELGQAWRQGNADYATLAPLRDAARSARMRGAVNRQVSPSDYGAMLVGATANPVAAGGALVANKLWRGNEHRLVAGGMEAVARLVESAPQSLGRYGAVLQGALHRGPGAYAATYYTLSQTDPAFREQMNRLEAQADGSAPSDEQDGQAPASMDESGVPSGEGTFTEEDFWRLYQADEAQP